jgi:hypothetical protein
MRGFFFFFGHTKALGEDPKSGPIEDSLQEFHLHTTGFET